MSLLHAAFRFVSLFAAMPPCRYTFFVISLLALLPSRRYFSPPITPITPLLRPLLPHITMPAQDAALYGSRAMILIDDDSAA